MTFKRIDLAKKEVRITDLQVEFVQVPVTVIVKNSSPPPTVGQLSADN